MIMTTIMITPMALQKCRVWTAPLTPSRMFTGTAMITVTGMTTAMPAIRMNTMPT
ncbi:hypothetical protein [Hyphomonas sp.]|uniref:hypothetical protein n=1 Tax=Hyphomonas sp. TaxID=87 RepID=UPI0026226E11|nr:hypothetical protein [Hyphomonas sp.]